MSGHRREKRQQKQPRNVIQPASQRGQGRRSAQGPQVFEVRLDSWTLPGTAQRNLITFHYFDGKIRQTVLLRFILVLLTSCQSTGNFTVAHTHTHSRTHSWIACRVHFRFSNKEHIHLFRARVWCVPVCFVFCFIVLFPILYMRTHTHTLICSLNICSAWLHYFCPWLQSETWALKGWQVLWTRPLPA